MCTRERERDHFLSLDLMMFIVHNLGRLRVGNWLIGQVVRVFANGPGGSIPSRVIPKTLKIVLDTSLLNTHQYKIRIKGKVDQSKERSSALPYISV